MCTNRIVFDIDHYGGNEKELFKDVAETLRILVKNNEICTFEYEDCGIYVLKHNYADISIVDSYPYWINPEEYEKITIQHDKDNDIDTSLED